MHIFLHYVVVELLITRMTRTKLVLIMDNFASPSQMLMNWWWCSVLFVVVLVAIRPQPRQSLIYTSDSFVVYLPLHTLRCYQRQFLFPNVSNDIIFRSKCIICRYVVINTYSILWIGWMCGRRFFFEPVATKMFQYDLTLNRPLL